MTTILILGAIGIVVLYGLVAMAATQSIGSLAGGLDLQPTQRPDTMDVPAAWAERNGFAYQTTFITLLSGAPAVLGIWLHQRRPTFFAVYNIQGKTLYDLVTVFNDRVDLTTGSTRDAQTIPKPPGHYGQSFDVNGPDALLNHHARAEHYLQTEGGAQMSATDLDPAHAIQKSIQEQVTHVMGLPLWQVRGPIWYFVRRNRWHGVSIEEQVRRGWVKLPRQL